MMGSKLPKGDLSLEIEEGKLSLLVGKSKYAFTIQDVSMYPETDLQSGKQVTLNAQAFCRALKATVFAVSSNDSTPALCGVHVKSTPSGLMFESTDRGQASLELLSMEETEGVDVIISTDTEALIQETFRKVSGSVQVTFGESLITISGNGTTIISRLLNGPFPELSSSIPTNFVSECIVSREELEGAFERALLMTGDKRREVKIVLEGDEFQIHAKSELGDGIESITTTESKGTMKTVVDCKMVYQALKTTNPCERIRVKYIEPLKPVLIEPLFENEDESRDRQILISVVRY
jgi:DNA polymerase-3 subunit beta